MESPAQSRTTHPRPRPGLPRLLLAIGLDYVRWLILTPMVLTWAFFLFMVVIMLLVNFGGAVSDALEKGYDTYRQHFGPAQWLEGGEDVAPATTESAPEGGDTVQFTGDDIVPWVMKAWGVLALAGWLLGMLRELAFGSRAPRSLEQKLRLAAAAAGIGWLLLFAAYFLGSETYHGSFLAWFALFTGSAVAVVVVSAVVMAVGHVVGRARALVLSGVDGTAGGGPASR